MVRMCIIGLTGGMAIGRSTKNPNLFSAITCRTRLENTLMRPKNLYKYHINQYQTSHIIYYTGISAQTRHHRKTIHSANETPYIAII